MDAYQNQARVPAQEQALTERAPSLQPQQALQSYAPPQQVGTADGQRQQQYAQHPGGHQQQHVPSLGPAVGGSLAVLPKTQDVRVQCEARDCQSLLQVGQSGTFNAKQRSVAMHTLSAVQKWQNLVRVVVILH